MLTDTEYDTLQTMLESGMRDMAACPIWAGEDIYETCMDMWDVFYSLPREDRR
jgi:hypothetical protein